MSTLIIDRRTRPVRILSDEEILFTVEQERYTQRHSIRFEDRILLGNGGRWLKANNAGVDGNFYGD